MEVLLSFVLSVQVGLSVFAYMRYLETIKQLNSKSKELVSCMSDLLLLEESSRNYHSQMVDLQKDIQILKAKSALGVR